MTFLGPVKTLFQLPCQTLLKVQLNSIKPSKVSKVQLSKLWAPLASAVSVLDLLWSAPLRCVILLLSAATTCQVSLSGLYGSLAPMDPSCCFSLVHDCPPSSGEGAHRVVIGWSGGQPRPTSVPWAWIMMDVEAEGQCQKGADPTCLWHKTMGSSCSTCPSHFSTDMF